MSYARVPDSPTIQPLRPAQVGVRSSRDHRSRDEQRDRCLLAAHRRRSRSRGVACGERDRQPMLSAAVRVMPPERRDPRQLVTRDVAARGARIRFVEAGDGPPLVLVHDYLASRIAWDDVLLGLSAHFRVIAPDLPGFGESEKPPPSRYRYDFDAFCESLADLIAAVGLGRVSLCGHAMGGAVALTLAATYAHVVDKLVLVNPLVYPPRPDALSRIAGVPILGPLVFKQLYGRSLFRNRFLDSDRATDDDGAALRRIDHLFDLFDVPAAREAAYATMLAMLDTRPLKASVPRVSAPTLVAWGRGNRTSPVEQGRRLARELGGARFEVFDCGRSPAEECPEAFTNIVASFLADGAGG
jgi:pimeloyl-ACP methyl ester carboxylesterase